jgi:uncharacterized protein YhbP (UPF0306 family)
MLTMSEGAYAYLAEHEMLTIATSSKDGVPHASALFYVSEGPIVYFSTSEATKTGRNLLENPLAAIALGDAPDPGQDWSYARGIAINGTVTKLADAEAAAALALFHAKYPNLPDTVSAAPIFRLDPTAIKAIHKDITGHEDFEALGMTFRRDTLL